MNEPESKSDWEDRLVDLALEESVGGQAPPDLSEKILEASQRASVATLQTGEQAMNDTQHATISKRKHWTMLAVAASLLVAVGMLAFMNSAGLNSARMAATTTPDQKTESSESSLERFRRPVDSRRESARELEEESGTTLSTVADLDAVAPVDKAMNEEAMKLMVTPQIVSQEAANDGRFNLDASGTVSAVDAGTPIASTSSPGSGLHAGSAGGDIGGRGAGQTPSREAASGRRVINPKEYEIVGPSSSISMSPEVLAAKTMQLAEMKSELETKHDEYLEFSKELDSSEASTQSATLSVLAKPYRDLQEQLLAKKKELIDLEVNKSIAAQSANSATALEAAVSMTLQEDPTLQSLQQSLFDQAQQLTKLKSIATGNRKSDEFKHVQDQIASINQQAQEYRNAKERELRDRLKAAPNEFLQQVMLEYTLRKHAITKDIVELEKRYKGKLDELEKEGQKSSKLALLNSDIENLTELTSGLELELRGRTLDEKVLKRREANAQLGQKIVEYQQLARHSHRRNSKEVSDRFSTLDSEIDQLRRLKRRLDDQQGRGPGTSGDQYARIYENPFVKTKTTEENFSTFSIDVDTASYANVRQFLMQSHQLPPPDAVRLEELVNYFDYDYTAPTGDVPFASHVEVAGCPWNADHRLVRIGIKGKEIQRHQRPQSNLVFLIDVSGSMNEPTKLPLLVEGMKLLTRELGENDKVAIVVYASSEGLALASTRGDREQQILAALDKLRAGGSTAGGAGIELAYKTAAENYIEGGVNRVILCTDGDFNVGVTSEAALEQLAEERAKNTGVFLTVLGFGRGNLNDSMMEKISGKGNGNYHYVDNLTEARKVLVEEMAGTLVTIAKDVKIQIDFNPHQVAGYRLLGYENRMLRTEDFNNDKKDAGEIGAGHTVTALYEIVPAGKSVDVPPVDASKYVKPVERPVDDNHSNEILTLRIRYKQPDADTSTKQEFPVTDEGGSFAEATPDFQFASAVASFGMLLRDSEHKGNTSYAAVKEITQGASKRDTHGYRAEFLQLVERARQLAGE